MMTSNGDKVDRGRIFFSYVSDTLCTFFLRHTNSRGDEADDSEGDDESDGESDGESDDECGDDK